MGGPAGHPRRGLRGVDHYWLVDAEGPSITALRLVDGAYVETATATGTEPLTLYEPFHVEIVPQALLDE